MAKEYTHDDMVARAARWLTNSYGCQTVFTEFESYTGEIPDAIGWKPNGRSVLVECKTSRADFLADRKKPFRLNQSIGLGAERYYMTMAGLILPSNLPEGWGLLEIKGNSVKIVVPCRPRKDMRSDFSRKHEMQMLLAALRRTQIRLGPVKLQDWLRFENRGETDRSMQKWVSQEDHQAYQLELEGYIPVVDPHDLPIDEISGEIWCQKHDCEFHECPCIEVRQEGYFYVTWAGVTYGVKTDKTKPRWIHPGTLVDANPASTLIQ